MKAKRSAFLKRKACVMKKTMELSVLCDVKACTIIVDADGTVETWPKDGNDVKPILDRYQQKHSLNKKKHTNNNVVVVENPKDVLSKLDSKIEAVKKRIEFLKGKYCVGDGEREEFSAILSGILTRGTSSSASVDVQEIGPTEPPCTLDYYYWDGQIDFSGECNATVSYVQQQVEQKAAYDDSAADFDLLLQQDFWSNIF